MILLAKPNQDAIRAFISSQEKREFSYAEVGCSQSQAPAGYVEDHNRIRLGQGLDTFARAKSAIARWKMFDMRWIELCWPNTAIETGATVGVLVAHLGVWSLNACRIVYVIQEDATPQRYGLAYGTLPGHAEIGEERFTVEYVPSDQSVWYDLYAISRPGPLARLAYPYARALQQRFARDSKVAMQRAVA
jgi:uncharacterized protein (UPF0548 family)